MEFFATVSTIDRAKINFPFRCQTNCQGLIISIVVVVIILITIIKLIVVVIIITKKTTSRQNNISLFA